MTRRTRKTIFYILVVLFFVIGIGVVLFAEGWRLDFSNFHVSKVGGIYVRSYPQNATIMLNGKSIPNQSNFLDHGTLISNLYPKNYIISLSLAGYDAWQENAAVEPSLVVEMKYAVLVPQTGTPVATTSDATNFFAVNGDVVTENAASASGTANTIDWQGAAVGAGTIVSHSGDLKNMIYRDVKGNYQLYDFTTSKTTSLSTILEKQHIANTAIESIAIDPYNDTSALVATDNRIVTIDLSGQTATIIATSSPGMTFGSSVSASQSNLAWAEFDAASGTSTVIIYDKFSNAITDESLDVVGSVQSLSWLDGNTLGVLSNNGSLLLYTLSAKTSRPLASAVESFYPSADGTMLAALEKNSLEVFDFAGDNYYRFNLPDMADVQSLAWYKDETHLFVAYPDRIAFFDLADTNLTNVTTISDGTLPSYDPQANSLYLLDPSGNVVRFDFPN